MIKPGEKPIRTKKKNMLLCTVKRNEAGSIDLISRIGNKEDSMSIEEFLAEIYGKD